MKEELLKLYYDYSINSKIADKDYIVKFATIVANYFEFSNFFTGILFVPNNFDLNTIANYNPNDFNVNNNDTKNRVLATYACNLKKIICYFDFIHTMVKNDCNYERLVSTNERIFYKNAIISTILLHEFEHINQMKSIFETSTIESDILRLSRCYQTENNETDNINKINEMFQVYNMFYEFAPEERLAEMNAHVDMHNIITPIKNLIPNVVKIEEILELKNKLKGYKYESKLISPTIFYLHSLGKEKELEKRPWYDESLKVATKKSKELFGLDKRLELGLPIDHLEYLQTERQLKRLTKKL